MTLNERIGVLLWHNFKVFVLLRFPKGGMEGGVPQPPKHPPKSTTIQHNTTLLYCKMNGKYDITLLFFDCN